jgi:3-hydroxyisobutyrate dehydrogenase-like beta-hydroxyacid dehydrogenase
MSTKQQVAFVGLGNLGVHMSAKLADKLAEQGAPPLLVWNRTKARAAEVASSHISPVESLSQVAAQADVIITSLANDSVVLAVVTELIANAKEGTLIIETSTVDPELPASLAKKAAERKVSYIASPVFGAARQVCLTIKS